MAHYPLPGGNTIIFSLGKNSFDKNQDEGRPGGDGGKLGWKFILTFPVSLIRMMIILSVNSDMGTPC